MPGECWQGGHSLLLCFSPWTDSRIHESSVMTLGSCSSLNSAQRASLVSQPSTEREGCAIIWRVRVVFTLSLDGFQSQGENILI